jgi:hypothetical protein
MAAFGGEYAQNCETGHHSATDLGIALARLAIFPHSLLTLTSDFIQEIIRGPPF